MVQQFVASTTDQPTLVTEHHVLQPQGIPLLLRYEAGAAGRPAVILLHGWGGSKERFQRTLSLDQHFVAAYVDLPAHGERAAAERPAGEVEDAVADAVQRGRDVERMAGEVAVVAEFLRARPEVDGARIGLLGWSQGGFAALLALTRQPGVAAAVAIAAPHSARLVHQ